MLFGWLTSDAGDAGPVISSMSAALRSSDGECLKLWPMGVFGIGVLERPFTDEKSLPEPVSRPDGYMLWMTGEAFEWPSSELRSAAESRTATFRSRLLDALVERGGAAIADLDGEYQIALWNRCTRTLQLFNDRFGALPLYVASSPEGCAFGGGVRGVLMAPGVSTEPDVEAIREAVSFGGYRLGGRTNVRDVRMVPSASVVTVSPERTSTVRYWTWSQLPDSNATDERAVIAEAQELWRDAIARRIAGSHRPGLMLSGGLDSRAILAEATRQRQGVRAVTYGVPSSDDVKIARRAAGVAGADWRLFPLYATGWLERRASRISETDGLIDLVDLMHTEPFETIDGAFDLYLSGYIGDVVAGSTWFFEESPRDLLSKLPYYGGALGVPYEKALELAEEMIRSTPGAPRFAIYEHKASQSTASPLPPGRTSSFGGRLSRIGSSSFVSVCRKPGERDISGASGGSYRRIRSCSHRFRTSKPAFRHSHRGSVVISPVPSGMRRVGSPGEQRQRAFPSPSPSALTIPMKDSGRNLPNAHRSNPPSCDLARSAANYSDERVLRRPSATFSNVRRALFR
jgi:hypothetical protein